MKNGKKRTLSQALMLNQTACQYCIGKNSDPSSKARQHGQRKTVDHQARPRSRQPHLQERNLRHQGLRLADGKYYHRSRNCSRHDQRQPHHAGTAMNYGKNACPVCAAGRRGARCTHPGRQVLPLQQGPRGLRRQEGHPGGRAGLRLRSLPLLRHQDQAPPARPAYKSGTSGIKVYAIRGRQVLPLKRGLLRHDQPLARDAGDGDELRQDPLPDLPGRREQEGLCHRATGTTTTTRRTPAPGASRGHARPGQGDGQEALPHRAPRQEWASSTGQDSARPGPARRPGSYAKATRARSGHADQYSAPATPRCTSTLTGQLYYYYHKSAKCPQTA